ncbi:MAG: glycosyltransferase family 4 protein [Acidaminococcaceae bacterium]|nr:glycosyltransferase family 4 protein [Acidaminococcaceae bacterium]
MNILYINHYAGSPEMGMEFRPYYLSREWVKMGHRVTIVAGDYSHLRLINPKVTDDFQVEIIDGIEYVWVKTGDYQGNGVKRAFSMFRFVWKLWSNADNISKRWKPNVVIASSTYPLDTYPAQKIARLSHAKYIHEVHDMWPITLIELGGMSRLHPFVILMQIAENSFCRNSDYVVSLLCAAQDYFVQHGMDAKKFKVVMNGIVKDEWENPINLPKYHQDLLTQLHDNGKFIICFFGSINKSYAIDYLLKATNKISDHNNVVVVIVGEGNQKEELQKQVQNRTDVFFLPKISKKAIPTLMDNIDCCYVGSLRNDMFRFGISMNKLFDSMMSGKPILYAVEAPNNFIEEYRCGITIKAEDADALSEGISKLVSMKELDRLQMGTSGRNAVLKHFTYEKLAKQFADLF